MADKRRPSRISAAIDVGSNSIHILIARMGRPAVTARRGLNVLIDRSQLLGLGDAVDELGMIPPDAQDQIVETLAEYLELAWANGARRVTLIGTEPLRRAGNAHEVVQRIERATGLALNVISVRAEGELTFIGATGGRPPAESMIVVDIGGGSTEIGIHTPGSPFVVMALAIGSARLTNAIVEHDPPTEAELERLHRAALDVRRNLPVVPRRGSRRPRAIFVGGTATNLARLGRVTSAGMAEDRRTLASMTSAEVTEHFGVRPRRARQLAAGAAIVEVLLDHFGLDEANVSDASLRDGAIIAASRLGDAWPDRLTELLADPSQAAVPTSSSH